MKTIKTIKNIMLWRVHLNKSTIYHTAVLSLLLYSLFLNHKMKKEVLIYVSGVHHAIGICAQTEFKLETALQMLAQEGPTEIERIAKPAARKEAIKVLQEFSDNFGRGLREDSKTDEEPTKN